MSFSYQRKTPEILERVAEAVFQRFPSRCKGCRIDVEGIVEDCGLTILPRNRGIKKYVEGYVASDPHYIIVSETDSSFPPRYRPIVAEELCHIILEHEFLKIGKLPVGAQTHRLSKQLYLDIESDAQYLSLAVLFPRSEFTTRFNAHLAGAPPEYSWKHEVHLRYCMERLEEDFEVWLLKAAYRAKDLGLISQEDCINIFSGRLAL